MRVITNERNIFIDVDDTIVMHVDQHDPRNCRYTFLDVQDPIDKTQLIVVGINKPMVRLLTEEAMRGSYITVWSRGGYLWAANVVKALGIEKHVDQVMTKPFAYFDDKDASQWMPDRVYITADTIYKQTK